MGSHRCRSAAPGGTVVGMEADTTLVDTVLSATGLRRRYGDHEAVRGIALHVGRGEMFALLGTNGAGKTTTVEVLEGLHRPDAGIVRVFGLDPVRDRGRVRPRTGVMLQDGGLPGGLTVGETLTMWRSFTVRPRPAGEVLELVELTDRRDVPVGELSGGEHRRLELALAVLGRPELLFLDEPTTGMDPASRRRTWEAVGQLRREGTTVLLTTHYLEEAEALADRVAILHAGRIVAAGAPDEVAATLPARITFRRPRLAPPQLAHATRDVDDRSVTYRTRGLQSDLAELLAWADGCGETLAGLSARPASLEDVFLGIAATAGSETGR
jgi:ABC-2 type transport system ATP-binding protein